MAGQRAPWIALGIWLTAVLAPGGTAPHAQQAPGERADEISEADWPCHGRYRPAFSAGAFWQGPTLDGTAAELTRRPEARKLAERVVAPETNHEEAEALIGGFAADQAGEAARGRALAVLFTGVLEEANLYRRFVLEGILGAVGRGRLAAAALAQSELALQGLAGDPSPAAAVERKALEQRRFWQHRAFERATGEARFLCHRLTALEGKLGNLARAIAGHL
jgi:hypothetical protein